MSALRRQADLPPGRASGGAHQGSQLWLDGLAYSYHAFLTDRDSELLEIEADRRRHAQIENVIRELKYGFGLNHMPSGKFGANAAWLALNVIAYNLSRWLARLGEQSRSEAPHGALLAHEGSVCAGFFDPAGPLTARADAPGDVAFHSW